MYRKNKQQFRHMGTTKVITCILKYNTGHKHTECMYSNLYFSMTWKMSKNLLYVLSIWATYFEANAQGSIGPRPYPWLALFFLHSAFILYFHACLLVYKVQVSFIQSFQQVHFLACYKYSQYQYYQSTFNIIRRSITWTTNPRDPFQIVPDRLKNLKKS